ncbi:hypothetical protein OUZ56_029489 [Daphnia magna]|uniref:Uncharacterized protein n=1 Tax=Daphnia magna TaxID=35525 RepID=A0ABR0B708_9CRUS|nr:hypothetical protein OUZ56_029489 [Daphnia magna]
MQHRMQRSKRRSQPQIPIEEILELMENYHEYRDAIDGGKFFRGIVQTVEGEALVFLSPTLLPKLSVATLLAQFILGIS